jgi:hypothetical protein
MGTVGTVKPCKGRKWVAEMREENAPVRDKNQLLWTRWEEVVVRDLFL